MTKEKKTDESVKDVVKKEVIKVSINLFSFFIILGVIAIIYFVWFVPKYEAVYGNGVDSVYNERYEITTHMEEYATYHVLMHWEDGVVEDYGEFKMFIGSPMKASFGGEWEEVVTVNYYSPYDTIKTEGNVKLIVTPKRAKVRGDPSFFRGIDYSNETRLEVVHIVTDAVFLDEETSQMTYNFEVGIHGNGIPINNSVTKIEVVGENVRLADAP